MVLINGKEICEWVLIPNHSSPPFSPNDLTKNALFPFPIPIFRHAKHISSFLSSSFPLQFFSCLSLFHFSVSTGEKTLGALHSSHRPSPRFFFLFSFFFFKWRGNMFFDFFYFLFKV